MKRWISVTPVLLLLLVVGCVSLNIKVPVYDNDALNEIHYRNEELARELANITGVNTAFSPYRPALVSLYNDYKTGRYGKAFKEIVEVGNGEYADYSPGLEALLWLYRTDQDAARGVLADYSLDALLHAAWGDCTGEQWDEWHEVRPRIAAPELAVYFTAHALRYIPERADGKNYLQSASETLLVGGGDCEDFALLIVEALESGGFFARLFTVDIYNEEGERLYAHTVAGYRRDHQWYFIQGFDGECLAGDVTGPFDHAYGMAEYIAGSIGGVPLYYYIDTVFEFLEAYQPLNRGRN